MPTSHEQKIFETLLAAPRKIHIAGTHQRHMRKFNISNFCLLSFCNSYLGNYYKLSRNRRFQNFFGLALTFVVRFCS